MPGAWLRGPGHDDPKSPSAVSARKVDNGNHPDLRIIGPVKKSRIIDVDAIDTIIEMASLRPTEAAWRVFILRDAERMREVITTWSPDTIYHAAAYKHVPLVEYNPAEGIKNNVLGTLRTAQVAADNGVSDFVLISTDKAVRPTNIMGASKRLAEMVLHGVVGW